MAATQQLQTPQTQITKSAWSHTVTVADSGQLQRLAL
jgi:hypothetical protein